MQPISQIKAIKLYYPFLRDRNISIREQYKNILSYLLLTDVLILPPDHIFNEGVIYKNADFIKKNDYAFINNCYDEGLLRALAKFRYDPTKKYNCDITISMALLVVLFEDEAEIEVIKHQEKRYDTPRFGYKRISNNFVLI